jgi:CRISPR locus-related DNA-binding protein
LRVFLMPLGFHEDILLRALNSMGARGGDVVYVLTCGPLVGAVKRAYESLRALCLRQGLPEPSLVELNCRDFYSAVKRVKEVVSAHAGSEVVFCSGGGLRILIHVVEVALLALRKPYTLHYEPEAEGVDPVTVPSAFMENAMRGLSAIEERVLREVIASPGVSVKELAVKLGLKEKSVRNVLTKLRKKGLVARRVRGRAEPTQIAIALYA